MRMRIVLLAFVTSAIVFFTGLSAASAKDYPYCIQGDDFAGGAGECISRPTRSARLRLRAGRLIAPTIATSASTSSSSTRAVRVAVRTDIGPRE
jgi:Protein of unknown function (DUF3551)